MTPTGDTGPTSDANTNWGGGGGGGFDWQSLLGGGGGMMGGGAGGGGGGGGGYDFSASGSTSNTAAISGPFTITDNSQGDLISILRQTNSPGAVAGQQPGARVNWLLVGGAALTLAAAAIYFFRRNQ